MFFNDILDVNDVDMPMSKESEYIFTTSFDKERYFCSHTGQIFTSQRIYLWNSKSQLKYPVYFMFHVELPILIDYQYWKPYSKMIAGVKIVHGWFFNF